MDYQLTQHAKDALLKRQIPRQWLERALFSPQWKESDAVDPDLEHRLTPIPEFQDRTLRVIVKVTVVPELVITLHFDRRRKRR